MKKTLYKNHNKLIKFLVGTLILAYLFILSFKLDDNNTKSKYDAVVVNLIQESTEFDVKYYGIFRLYNDKVIDIELSRKEFATIKIGEEGTLNLNKYQTGEVNKSTKYVFFQMFLMLSTTFLLYKTVIEFFNLRRNDE